MSCTAIPTKTSAERPPILPPIRTTFDGSSDGGDNSVFARLRDGVRHLVRHSDATEGESLQTMIELLESRRRTISREILAEIAFDDLSLPPFEEIDEDLTFLFISDREERMLQGLIDELDICKERCERRLARHRLQMRLLRDLGASES